MNRLDQVLAPFAWVNSRLGEGRTPGEVFVLSLLFYALLLLIGGVLAHEMSKKVARIIRGSARRLARGAVLSDVVRLESSSARIESALYWVGSRIVRSSYGMSDRIEHVPDEGGERGIVRAGRWLLRSLWLLLSGLLAALSALPGFVLTAFGLSVLVLAFFTAFPDLIHDTAVTIGAFIAGASWSEASAITAITVGAAVVPIAVIVTKVAVSEPATARRSVRRRRNEAALEQLATAETAIAALAEAIRDQMYDLVRLFEVEKRSAQQWFEWTRASSPLPGRWQQLSEDHLECSRKCLDPQVGGLGARAYEDNLQAAVSAVEQAWRDGLNENRWILASLMSRRARRGLHGLSWCFSSSGEFWMTKLPCTDEWRRRRITWQHRYLTHGPLTPADIQANRTVDIRPGIAPDMRWLEADLLRLVWDLAELCRELDDLADYTQSLSRPRRFERVMRATE